MYLHNIRWSASWITDGSTWEYLWESLTRNEARWRNRSNKQNHFVNRRIMLHKSVLSSLVLRAPKIFKFDSAFFQSFSRHYFLLLYCFLIMMIMIAERNAHREIALVDCCCLIRSKLNTKKSVGSWTWGFNCGPREK